MSTVDIEKKFLNYLNLTNIYKNTSALINLTQEQLDDINDSSILKNRRLKKS